MIKPEPDNERELAERATEAETIAARLRDELDASHQREEKLSLKVEKPMTMHPLIDYALKDLDSITVLKDGAEARVAELEAALAEVTIERDSLKEKAVDLTEEASQLKANAARGREELQLAAKNLKESKELNKVSGTQVRTITRPCLIMLNSRGYLASISSTRRTFRGTGTD